MSRAARGNPYAGTNQTGLVPRVGRYALLIVLVAGCVGPNAPGPTSTLPPPPVSRDAIVFETESGDFTVILYPEAAPRTVELVKSYAAEGYYAGREFNRVVPGHVIQVVDKAGGASDDPRRVPLETDPDYHFSAGAAGIARGADPNSGGPELFFMDFGTSHLDGNYTVWGQLVDGLDVVHHIARVPTVDLTQIPGASDYLTDRQAVDAVTITRARLVHIELPGERAAHYPLQVARNARVGDWRHSLEWPNDLHAGRPSDLTWYVRTYNDSNPAPPARDLTIRVEGAVLSVVGDADAPGALHWAWTPPRPGHYDVELARGTETLATLGLDVTA